MPIELAKVKYAKFASQETSCFSADVVIDGKKAGSVENDGHGGSHRWHPHTLENTVADYALAQPSIQAQIAELHKNYGDDAMFDDERTKYDRDFAAEMLINELLEAQLQARRLKALLKSRFVFVKDGKLYTAKPKQPAATFQSWVDSKTMAEIATALKADSGKVLNKLPFDRALALYLAHG